MSESARILMTMDSKLRTLIRMREQMILARYRVGATRPTEFPRDEAQRADVARFIERVASIARELPNRTAGETEASTWTGAETAGELWEIVARGFTRAAGGRLGHPPPVHHFGPDA